MLRNWSGMITFLAPAHMLDATQLFGDDNIRCTCTHVGRRLLKRPGLLTVLQSMATYRAARVNALGHAPADFLSLNNDSKWIYEWRHGRGEKKTKWRSLKTSQTCGEIDISNSKSLFYHTPNAQARNCGKMHVSDPFFIKRTWIFCCYKMKNAHILLQITVFCSISLWNDLSVRVVTYDWTVVFYSSIGLLYFQVEF